MTEPEPLELGERKLGANLRDSLRIYFRHFGAFIAVGLAVIIPAELIVAGIALDQFDAGTDAPAPDEASIVTLAVHALVTTPLVIAMTAFAALGLADGKRPRARDLIQSGLDVFRSVFWPVAIVVGIVAAISAAVAGLTLEADPSFAPLVLIPLYLYVRWYFVPHAVVAGQARGLDALRASWERTRGSVLRAAGTLLLAALLFGIAAQVAATPLLIAAEGLDSGALIVLYGALAQSLAAPALALVSVFLWFDLIARNRAA